MRPCYLVLAAGMALAWSLVDWRKTNYAHLREWLRVYVRFYLASMMISYGAVKVIKSQFPDPSLDRLIEPFGDASPMGLLWTFMGASVSYNVFAGAGEILGGLLLTTRRTTTFGALIGIGVLGNVAMLNFSYDVPVKLFSLHLLAMAAFLLIPDLRRLAKFLVFNRPVNPTDLRPLFPWRWVDWTAAVLRTTIVVAFTGLMFANAYRSQGIFGDRAPKSPLRGVWNVDEFQIDGKTRPPLLTDADRWRRVVFDYPSMVSIQLMSNSRVRHALFLDPDQRTLALMNREHPSWNTKLRYELPEPDHLVIQGNYGGHPMRADLRRTSDSDFLLVNRGFHWINEYPFNR
jgi:uncharacterized membrane protein YphA (DoxX/SURF4 family)